MYPSIIVIKNHFSIVADAVLLNCRTKVLKTIYKKEKNIEEEMKTISSKLKSYLSRLCLLCTDLFLYPTPVLV